ncbi:hypothetical protein THARTR1_10321 [Trichoderma harzianum]|uniref:DUF7025 domain-containing protein n=1 Tax=Trichoderma harzianum TaxID=5544 RepID=A0A2K0TSP7_TRIHA|nr:hypothetical protein THARTR1_10321 [Trichoderma harzianum]
MEPGYSSFLTRETNETRELPVERNNDEIQAHSTSAFVSASEGHSSAIIPSESTALNEVQQLKQQLEHLKMQMTTFISREPEKEPTKSGPEDVEMLQRVKECLRNHSDEWNSHDNLAEFSTESSLRTAVDALQRSIYYKSHASERLVLGYTHDTHIYEQYYDSSDDEIANDEQYRNIRDRLIAKRREYVRSVELNMEVISEELIKFRLAKKLRKKELEREKKEAEQKEAEKIAAEKRAAEEKAAASAANEETTSDETFEVPIFAQPTINTVDWNSFRKLRKVDESLACAIDVLVGEPVIEVEAPRDQYGVWTNNWNSDDLTEETAQVQKPNPIVSSKPQGQIPLPERVRIHSTPILTILAELIDPEGTKPTLDGSPVIFLRPFKAFFHYEQRLRDWHKRLVEKFSPSSVSNEPVSEGGTSNASYHATESTAALNHLQCLLEFFDTYMIAKKEFLAGADCRKVHFSDLWCLYRPGMEVIGLDGRQAYRILQVNSAKHESISPYRSFYSYRGGNSQKAEFSMICSYIDFNGKSIGPVLRTFEIKRFDGERDITSFDVYPLRFHKLRRGEFSETEWNNLEKYPEQDRCRRNLIQRGAKFVEVAAIKHMYYSGSTMVVREEVESQVVVDFETAFATEGETREHIRPPTLETFIGEAVDKHMESSSSSGRCTCCIGDIVYDDAYIDKNQRNTYINDFLSIKNAQEEPSVAVFPRLFSEIRTNSASARHFTDDELAIMSYRVFGFVLRNRKWGK